MNGKERILKMLEEGQITTKEAIDLMNALNYEEHNNETNDKTDNDNSLFKFFENMTDEVCLLYTSDAADDIALV